MKPDRSYPTTFLALLLLVTLVTACGGGGDRPDAFALRDSAGVRIAENSPALVEGADTWTLSPQPILDIGTVEGPEEYQLFRVNDALLLPGGGVLVVNAGSAEIRHFDAAGRFVSSFGRSGEGPGKFRVPTDIARYGSDSVAVWDYRLQRLAFFTLDGTFGRQVRPSRQASNPSFLTVFDDGSFVVRDDRFDIPASGFADMEFTLVRYATTGGFADSAGTYYMGKIGALGDVGMVGGPVFGPRGEAVGSAAGFWVADGREYEVRHYDREGSLLAIVRWSGPARSVEAEDVDALWSKRLEGRTGDDRRRTERMREVTPVAEEFPATFLLQVATDGRLWVQSYPRPRSRDSVTWWVFDEEGRMLAVAAIPMTFMITDIGDDVVLGVERDSLDIEHVRLYGITR